MLTFQNIKNILWSIFKDDNSSQTNIKTWLTQHAMMICLINPYGASKDISGCLESEF